MFQMLEKTDRRIIYLLVALSLAIPLVMNVDLRPAPMATADAFFAAVDRLEPAPGKIVLISADWGPGTLAENRPQTALAIEHLMRKRIPFALISMYALASPFLEELPREVAQRLEREMPEEKWSYGKDWVNLGYRPGGIIMIQGLANAADIKDFLKTDANNIPLQDLPAIAEVKTIGDIPMLMEFTGLLGVFNSWVQYFRGPPFVYGCTSVTIPEAFIYFASKQIVGFFEGIAGAAWYEVLLSERYPKRGKYNVALRVNTGLSFAHLVVLAFIVLGNIGLLAGRKRTQV
jgi:hypothetical protein